MKKLVPLLVILLLVGAFAAFLYVNGINISELKLSDLSIENFRNIKNLQNLSGPGLAAKRALEMWDNGDYAQLHRNFAADVKQVLPLEAFVKTKRSVLVGGVLRPQIEEVKEEGDTATVTASVTNLDIKSLTQEIFGKSKEGALERQKVLIELRHEGGVWRISQFDPIAEALRIMDEEAKKKRRDVEASQEGEAYMPKVTVTSLRAAVIHAYGREPFIVGVVKNTGNRDIQKLGIKFTVRDLGGGVVVEDTYHPVVESSISEEERPLRPGEERKISYQVDRVVPDWEDTSNVTFKIVEIRVGPEYEPAVSPEDQAKDKIKKARAREGK